MMIKKLLSIAGGVLCAHTLMAVPTYSFKSITANTVADSAIGESQSSMQVTDYGPSGSYNQVLFKFINSGPSASSICDVYFDDGVLLGIASFPPSAGVSYTITASPGNLPGAQNYDFNPEYNGTKNKYFAADSDPAVEPNGVNPGESLNIVFKLQSGKTYADVLASLALAQTDIYHDIVGGLRVGIHVQGFADGGSISMLNGPEGNIPPPIPDASSTVTLLGLALLGLGGLQQRFLRK